MTCGRQKSSSVAEPGPLFPTSSNLHTELVRSAPAVRMQARDVDEIHDLILASSFVLCKDMPSTPIHPAARYALNNTATYDGVMSSDVIAYHIYTDGSYYADDDDARAAFAVGVLVEKQNGIFEYDGYFGASIFEAFPNIPFPVLGSLEAEIA
eukprot:7065489-Karenia_brevis.AAC.1